MGEEPILNQQDAEFWMVWTKTGHKPWKMHHTAASAETEAKRLAVAHPGKKFVVLRGYAKFIVATAPAASVQS